ncbi:thiamine-monophosphate kinase [Paenibacillus sp. 1_12]|uniref:thiamine-phosphate kinase n=1 Tax=Paenibacillus sp. 1_12 TaxID=1566278 RepID=UPI0008E8358C|nr:thiamine-phosphate kinase [Paenibacillus sp. 1_12]SFL72247.1 thiamine-monophosphate kinase [Paenibacillus sp. 1_12]
MSSLDEFALIRRLTEGKQSAAFQQASGVDKGIGDDAAVAYLAPGCQLVMTCDTMTESIHFQPNTMRDSDVGYKAMAAAISDIGAMGAIPRYALVALSIPQETPLHKLEAIYQGLYECANRWSVVIVGGDTTSCIGGLTLTVTVIGEVSEGQALLRSSAKTGDVLFATGELGCSAAGLDYLLQQALPFEQWPNIDKDSAEARLIAAHCRPEPQIEIGQLLQQSKVCGALNDVSDGLASEAWEIAQASGVGIDLIEDRIPIADELMAYAEKAEKDPLHYILYGGEDYKLIGTMQAEHAIEMQIKFREAGHSLYIIGYVNAEDSGVRLVQSSGYVVPIEKKGYNHFRKD